MSEELQTAEETEVIDQEDTNQDLDAGTAESGSELAADSGEDHEQINQESINKAINKQHAKFREEERKRKEVEAKAQELQQRLDAIEANKPKPEIPPIPDPYDDDYETKVKARDEALLAKANYDAEQAVKAKAKIEQEKEAEDLRNQELKKSIDGYHSKALEIGLDKGEVEKAGQLLVDYGVTPDLAVFLLEDQDGPLMTKYLAANPAEFDEINRMSPMNAAIALNNSVRAKASGLKPKQSTAPDPVKTLNGLGPGETVPASIKGAKFE